MRHFYATLILLLSCGMAWAQPEVGRFSITPKIGGSMCWMTGNPDAIAHVNYVQRYNIDRDMYFCGDSKTRFGWQGGADIRYQITERSGISVGIGYSAQGMRLKKDNLEFLPQVTKTITTQSNRPYFGDGTTSYTIVLYEASYAKFKNVWLTLGYLTIPVTYNYYIGKGFSANAGLQIGIRKTRKVHYECQLDDWENSYYMESYRDEPHAIFRWEDDYGTQTKITMDWPSLDNDQIKRIVLSAPISLSYEWHRYVAEVRYCIDLTDATDWKSSKLDENGFLIESKSAHSRNSVLSLTVGYRFQL